MKSSIAITTTAGLLAALALSALSAPAPLEAQATFRTTPPPALPLEPVSFPDYHRRALTNGAEVLVVEHHEQPVVSINLRVRSGSTADPEGRVGAANFVAGLIDAGTTTRSSREVAEALDFIGATLSAAPGQDWTSITLTTITPHLDRALELLADVIMNATFPEDELETYRTRILSSLQVELSQPAALASRRFVSEIYGDHPYGRLTTPETVRAIQREDLVRFHEAHFRPGNTTVVVAGDVTTEDIVSRLERHLGGWSGGVAADPALPEPPSRTGRTLYFVHQPGTVQAVVRLGHLVPSATGADWVAMDVATHVLGGGTTGWLFRVLRAEKGYTYGAYAGATERPGPGYFQATAEVRNEVADSAVAELLSLVERLRSEPVPADDLEKAQAYLAGSFPLSIETPQQVASQLATTLLLGRSADYLDEYRGRIMALSAADVGAAARSYIHPDRAALVVVGDATQILDKVSPFADRVEIFDVEGERIQLADLIPRASEVALDPSGLEPGVRVYDVLVQGNPFGQATYTLSREQVGGVEALSSTQEIALAMGDARQTVIFDARTFAPIRATSSGAIAPGMELRLEGGRVLGSLTPPPAAGGGEPREIDMEVPDGTLLPGMEELALAVSDLSAGELTLPLFDPSSGTVVQVRYRVVGEQTITVPAGEFEVFEVDQTGGQPSKMYVRKQWPHIVIRQDPAGQPVSFQLSELR